ncbi:DNA alkylation repair protein [Curtobacterium sp. SORGH_AS_0776]|uniref:DNA alkylation repair protein n=1 Tax=Curtobacterium sp. SORGH_AS_0776 TaxID=3041798 RepID=UPI00286551AA|nr:DNA alkylation repair protein [Curtobacterium sp. SORGH_AS_0776]MDR6170020.1 3-methyladenine DNA glycosylase AlkD [Curtobacterium sp. SORGH_AS_0776]
MTRLQAGGGRNPADAEAVLAAFARTTGDVTAARRVARQFADLDEGERSALLWSEDAGARLVAVILMVQAMRAHPDPELTDEYLSAAKAERFDDTVLVDLGAEELVGAPLVGGSTGPLFALVKSDVAMVRRIALVATLAFVKQGDAEVPLAIAGRLVRERSDTVQSALGWVLRETGKRASEYALVAFLERQGRFLSPAARATATEHLPAAERDRLRG